MKFSYSEFMFSVTGINLWVAVALVTGVALLYTILVSVVVETGYDKL